MEHSENMWHDRSLGFLYAWNLFDSYYQYAVKNSVSYISASPASNITISINTEH